MVDTARARRLAKRIVSIVATQIQHEVKDPRLDMVTITAATVTPDLREATGQTIHLAILDGDLREQHRRHGVVDNI